MSLFLSIAALLPGPSSELPTCWDHASFTCIVIHMFRAVVPSFQLSFSIVFTFWTQLRCIAITRPKLRATAVADMLGPCFIYLHCHSYVLCHGSFVPVALWYCIHIQDPTTMYNSSDMIFQIMISCRRAMPQFCEVRTPTATRLVNFNRAWVSRDPAIGFPSESFPNPVDRI
jgi:hypothetical protein